MHYFSRASQPLGTTVTGRDGNPYLNGEDAIRGCYTGSNGCYVDKIGRTWLSEAEREFANLNIDHGESWRGADPR